MPQNASEHLPVWEGYIPSPNPTSLGAFCARPRSDKCRKANPAEMLLYAGASTPYKRWSKCTMEKVGGSVAAETLLARLLV